MSTSFVTGPAGQSMAPIPSNTGGVENEYWTDAGVIRGPMPRRETEAAAERGQATIADPLPLGLVGFAAATFTISTVYAGWFGLTAVAVAIPIALVYGGIGQFLAGMWAFARGNVLAATAFGTFGCFNAAWAILQIMGLQHTVTPTSPAAGTAYVTGIFVITFGFISAYLAVAALNVNKGLVAVLGFLALAYLADGVGTWLGGHNWILSIGGYSGMVTSLIAAYVAAAIVINSGKGREVLPLFQVHK